MSFHAHSSNEVRSSLARQRKQSVYSSFLIALLLFIFLLLALFIFKTFVEAKEAPLVILLDPPTEEPADKSRVLIQSRPSAPNHINSRIITANSTSPVALPEFVFEVESADYTTSAGAGPGWEFGDGPDRNPGGDLPEGLSGRCSEKKRIERLIEGGGTEACEASVVKALRWLKHHQYTDGSWGEKDQIAHTGLALLAYFGHCETPVSDEFGDTVLKAIVFLCDVGMKNEGRLCIDPKESWCYGHAIATYALCECFTFANSMGFHIPNLDQVTYDAVRWILNNPNEIGGWNYHYGAEKRYDTSINAWHIQALAAARRSGMAFPNLDATIKTGIDAIAACQISTGAVWYTLPRYGDNAGWQYQALTAAGVLCFQMILDPEHLRIQSGMSYIGKHSSFDFQRGGSFYDHYYISQAAMNSGGHFWKGYNRMFRDELLENQNQDGSWPSPAGDPHSPNIITDTCFATLILEVYYRYLPTK